MYRDNQRQFEPRSRKLQQREAQATSTTSAPCSSSCSVAGSSSSGSMCGSMDGEEGGSSSGCSSSSGKHSYCHASDDALAQSGGSPHSSFGSSSSFSNDSSSVGGVHVQPLSNGGGDHVKDTLIITAHAGPAPPMAPALASGPAAAQAAGLTGGCEIERFAYSDGNPARFKTCLKTLVQSMTADPVNLYFLGSATRSERFSYNEVHGYLKVRAAAWPHARARFMALSVFQRSTTGFRH